MALRTCNILSIFYFKNIQKASNMLTQNSNTNDPKQTKIDRIFSAIFREKLRGHFRMLKSQNVSHALCVQECSCNGLRVNLKELKWVV